PSASLAQPLSLRSCSRARSGAPAPDPAMARISALSAARRLAARVPMRTANTTSAKSSARKAVRAITLLARKSTMSDLDVHEFAHPGDPHEVPDEIGRASCRERVQTTEI